MLIKIMDAGALVRTDVTRRLTQALIGTWGVLLSVYYLGRLSFSFVSDAAYLVHDGSKDGIALVVYEDDSFSIIVVPRAVSVPTPKIIKLALIVAPI
jgi:hypothetical protein